MEDIFKLKDPFEIFVQKDKIGKNEWDLLVQKISTYSSKFTIEIVFNTNLIELFLYCDKDLYPLSTKIEGFILRPTGEREKLASYWKSVGFKLSHNQPIIDQREKEEFKKGRIITNIFIKYDEKFSVKTFTSTVLFKDRKEERYYSRQFGFSNPLVNFDFDFRDSNTLKKKSSPVPLKFNEALELFTPGLDNSLLEVFGFPYFSTSHFVGINSFDFNKHSLIVGQTGVGKSKFIELLVKTLQERPDANDYSVVIIDPHSALFQDASTLRLPNINFDFIENHCELFPSSSEPKISTELTILLFKTLLGEQFNAKMERTLKYVLFTLFLTNSMSVENMKNFLIDLDCRKKILGKINNKFLNIIQFFDTEYIEIQTKYYESAIMPILVLVDELQFLPAFDVDSSADLEKSVKNNFLTRFSLDRIYLGDKATRLIAGLLIQQLFLIAQKKTVNKKIILIVDEVSTVENESLIHVLSEARKFNFSLLLAQQYLTQISPDLLKGILSNVYNYFIFKVSDQDARIISKNLDISFPDDVLLAEKEKGITEEDLKRNILVNLNPRECIVRFFGNGKFYPSFKAKTLNS